MSSVRCALAAGKLLLPKTSGSKVHKSTAAWYRLLRGNYGHSFRCLSTVTCEELGRGGANHPPPHTPTSNTTPPPPPTNGGEGQGGVEGGSKAGGSGGGKDGLICPKCGDLARMWRLLSLHPGL
ncbi:hypothetical protein LSTR_LSTR014187 [Laodelphax striatellus]|uniref:Uncharacterized protein n=1 Tax=Laodelphax striatellus TaxID=195883 RepID=A0A482WPU5_LAOST|nr:hypothetical protein LSTR_LSTR014187 [Laodelphax striatellus]